MSITCKVARVTSHASASSTCPGVSFGPSLPPSLSQRPWRQASPSVRVLGRTGGLVQGSGEDDQALLPGTITSYEWLHSKDHKRADRKTAEGDSCISCHEGEEQEIGELIVSGGRPRADARQREAAHHRSVSTDRLRRQQRLRACPVENPQRLSGGSASIQPLQWQRMEALWLSQARQR